MIRHSLNSGTLDLSFRRTCLVLATLFAGGLLAGTAPPAHALPIVVPDFAVDPSGAQFTISPIAPGSGLSNNLAAAPSLTYGVIDPTTGVTDTLQMNWEALDEGLPSQAGWELVFGVDPDIRNQTLSLSISPPGQGGGVGSVTAITHLEILVRDFNGQSAGIWGFNTDQMGGVPLGNDPTAAGKAPLTPPPVGPPPIASLANNVMHTVTINLGTGPAAGSATIFDGTNTFVGPNYIFGSAGGSLATAASLEFYENGNLAGALALPAAASPGLNNYWDHITLTPEPSSMSLAAVAVGGLFLWGWRRRKR